MLFVCYAVQEHQQITFRAEVRVAASVSLSEVRGILWVEEDSHKYNQVPMS